MPHLALLLTCALLAPENLIPHADLEPGAEPGALPDGWYTFAADDATYTFAIAPEGIQERRVLVVTGDGEYGGVNMGRAVIDPAKLFIASGKVRFKGTGKATIKLDYAAGEEYLGSTYAGFVEGGGDDWTEIRIADRRREFPTATAIAVAAVVSDGGTAWFDELHFGGWPVEADPADNLLENGGFESGIGLTPTDLQLSYPPEETPLGEWTPDAAHDGARGVRLANAPSWAVWAQPPFEPEEGAIYTLTGWVRCRGGEAFIKFDFHNDTEWLGQQASEPAPTTGEWVWLTRIADLSEFPTATRITATVGVAGAETDADFDSLRVIQTQAMDE